MTITDVKILNESPHPLPHYATTGSSGMDLRAYLPEPYTLPPMHRVAIPTGIKIQLPPGFEAQVRPRSGMALQQGITCLNSPGTIDSDYRGEIKAILINLSSETHIIQNGDRIAQLVIQKVEKANWIEVAQLEQTVRNEGGFGHSGIQ
jgi:dUTP pyrophosphatase